MADMTGNPVFPCTELPDNPAEARLLGLYPQRQEGLWLQRVKVLGGFLEPRQWEALADCCERVTAGTPLLITTRQDIEFHNLSREAVPQLQKSLAESGFTGLCSCGDTLRNITLCPGNGLTAGAASLRQSAEAVLQELMQYEAVFSLPRKFKINFSGCGKSCGQPWINDLGFVARQKEGSTVYRVIGAGSLGSRPDPGIVLREELDPSEAPAFALAALQLFNEHGDREHRNRARLRHVRERLGDGQFLCLLNEAFERCRKTVAAGPALGLPEKKFRRIALLTFPCGLLEPAHARAIAGSCFVARIQNHHRIALYTDDPGETGEAVHQYPVLGRFTAGLDIVACPGTTWCKHALVNTHALEQSLRKNLPPGFGKAIRISGCPNGCAHSAVGQIGLIGRKRKDGQGTSIEGVRLLAGGGMGLTPELAHELEPFVPARDVPDRIICCDQ